MSSLRYVSVLPAGGGKTTLSRNPNFLDIDALYNLRETESTYKRVNHEIRRRFEVLQPVPASVGSEFRSRVAIYRGQASCLLVHSIPMADQSGLQLLRVLVPTTALHKIAIVERELIDKWFA